MSEQSESFQRITAKEQEQAEDQIILEQAIVDYQIREYPIDVIINKYNKDRDKGINEIFIPEYQRKFVWSLKQQSKFIESLMLGLPTPYIVTADDKGRLEIVDGSQRIRTLDAFFNNRFALVGLKILTTLNGFRHKDLPLSRQRRFNRKTIRIIELTEKANKEVRKDIFERINTSPTELSDMEIRKGVYEGEFYDFLKECSENVKFKILCPISDVRIDREERPEMILRFFAYAENYENFDHIVKDFLDSFIEEKQKNFNAEELAKNFENMLDFADKHFPYGFKKSPNAKSTPRVRFEALSVGIHLALKENPKLIPNPVSDWLNSDKFKIHTRSDASNTKSKVINRIEYVRDKLLEK